MSDSEVEFQSADEGSNGDDGWDIECDFDLPDVEPSAGSKSTQKKLSSRPKISNLEETEQNLKHKDIKPANNCTSDTIPKLQARLVNLEVKNDNVNSEQNEESKVVQNEIKSTSTQSSVSKHV